MDDGDARTGELRLTENPQATWRARVVAAVVGGALVPMWIIAVDRLVPLQWGLFPPHDYRRVFYIGLVSAAVACIVSLRVARMRQPRGARISWDEWGISEWDGDGVRVAIPWSEAVVGVRCDVGDESLVLAMLDRPHLARFGGGNGAAVIGVTLRIQGAHGREIWVTDGVQTPALAGRLTTVETLAPLFAAIEGKRVVPMGGGQPGENALALFYIAAIGGYVCATLGLGILLSTHTVPTFVPHFLGGSACCLAVRALLPCSQHRRLAAREREFRGARAVTFVDNDGPLITAEDQTHTRLVIDTRTLEHPDGRLHERRGAAFVVAGDTGDVVAVETAAIRRARRTYQRALAVEFMLRAMLVIPIITALLLFHTRISADKAWTVSAGPYSSYDTAGSLVEDGSVALIATHTSPGHDLSLFELSGESSAEVDSLDLGVNNSVEVLALAPDHARAVISRGYDTLVWEVGERHARPRGSLAAAKGVVVAVFSRDGDRLLTGGSDGAVSVWDTAGFDRLHTFTGHTGEVLALSFSPDGALAASGGADGTARILDLNSGTPGAVLAGHDDRVQVVAFVGEAVVTGAADGKVRFFATDGTLAKTVAAHRGGVTALGLHPGGAFATAGDDHVIRVWDADWRRDGCEDLGLIDMHTDEAVRNAGRISGVAFSVAHETLLAITSHGMLLHVDLGREEL